MPKSAVHPDSEPAPAPQVDEALMALVRLLARQAAAEAVRNATDGEVTLVSPPHSKTDK